MTIARVLLASFALFGLAVPAAAQGDVDEKLAYVAGVGPERTYYCRVMPQGAGTSETRMLIDFTLDGAGPVEARVQVTGRVGGRFYNARMRFVGRAGPTLSDPPEAVITLDEVHDFTADPLPNGAQWSDPEGDVITLQVDRYSSMGSQPYILTGTQVSEFGVNDLRCLDGTRM